METEFAQIVDGLSCLQARFVGKQHPPEEVRAARDADYRAVMEGLSGYGNSQLFEEFGSAERDDVLIDMPEDSDASRFLYSVERQALPGQPAIGRIVRKAS
jgi:hypothetical protein